MLFLFYLKCGHTSGWLLLLDCLCADRFYLTSGHRAATLSHTHTHTHTFTHTLVFSHTDSQDRNTRRHSFFSVTLKYHCRQEGLQFLIVARQISLRSLHSGLREKTILDGLFLFVSFRVGPSVTSISIKMEAGFQQTAN